MSQKTKMIPLCFDRMTYIFFKCFFLGNTLSKGFYLLSDISANLERKISIHQVLPLQALKRLDCTMLGEQCQIFHQTFSHYNN